MGQAGESNVNLLFISLWLALSGAVLWGIAILIPPAIIFWFAVCSYGFLVICVCGFFAARATKAIEDRL